MKATGIVRRIDDLGRVVIPKEIRRTLRIREGDPLEIYLNHRKRQTPKGVVPQHFSGLLFCFTHLAHLSYRFAASTMGTEKEEK